MKIITYYDPSTVYSSTGTEWDRATCFMAHRLHNRHGLIISSWTFDNTRPGKRLHSYGKSLFLMGTSTITMERSTMFNG